MAAIEHDLRESLVYVPDWRVFERLGDVASGAHEYVEASERYMYAVLMLRSEQATPNAPDNADIARALGKFAAAWSVADASARPLPRLFGAPHLRMMHREAPWVVAFGIEPLREFTPPETLLPVMFHYARAEFSGQASQVLVMLRLMLDRIGSPTLTVWGHADRSELEVDPDLDLEELARARAEAVKTWFEEQNYDGRVVVAEAPAQARYAAAGDLRLTPGLANWFGRRVDYRWDTTAR